MTSNPIIAEDVARIASANLPWENFAGASVLVTGAAGFLPAYLVETLLHLNRTSLSRPARIVALVRNAAPALARFGDPVQSRELDLLVQDVTEPIPESYRFDYIIHAASQASPRYYAVDPVGTLSANVFGTRNLLTAAQRQPLRGFLFFSSGDVYGVSSDPLRAIGEKDYGYVDCTDFRSCYGESKRMGETMCVAWAKQYGVPARMVRPFHTYGPGMRLDDGRVFADFVRDILSGGPIVLHSDGSAVRSFCYLADATEAFFRVLLQGFTGEAYNVANPNAVASIAGLAQRLAELFQVQVERRGRSDNHYVSSPIPFTSPATAKIEALGWSSRTSIEEGFARTVASYRPVPISS
ncbi:MAG: NAD-dependent epimerase/dehydratase family protein [Bryobacteraceae bacterium]|nr:NAD-dependent epimerase/dehydratase family protein [Bryobacteraceae bacterium]